MKLNEKQRKFILYFYFKMEWKLDIYYLFFGMDFNGVISSSDIYLDKDDLVDKLN